MSQTGVSVGVDASAALSKSGAYHMGLVPVSCCLLHPLPLQGENKHRSTSSRRRLVQGWPICPSVPRLVSPCLIYVCSPYWSPDTAAALSVWQGRLVNHWGDPAWHQLQCAAYLVDASWCNEHNGDGRLHINMAAFSIDIMANWWLTSSHIWRPCWFFDLSWSMGVFHYLIWDPQCWKCGNRHKNQVSG